MNKSPKYWIACSGGVDSVVLVRLFYQMKEDFGILHCNFHLRGEDSNKDEVLVRTLAEELNCPIQVRSFDTIAYMKEKQLNLELAARELRYQWFDTFINAGKIVVLAHHRDDQIETFFIQLRRGGKVRGLASMPRFRKGYLRPLLNYTKTEIYEIAQKNDWKWREDKSNQSNKFLRNWYRNELIPFFESNDFNTTNLLDLITLFQEFLSDLKKYTFTSKIKIEEWLKYPIWLKEEFLLFHQLDVYSAKEIDRLARAPKGKYIENDTKRIWREEDSFYIETKDKAEKQYTLVKKIVSLKDISLNSNDIFVDSSKIKGELKIRKWKSGDYFQPLGSKGTKTVAKFLRDRKVPSSEKKNFYILTDDTKEVIGIFGFGVGEKFKIDNSTQEVARLQLIKLKRT